MSLEFSTAAYLAKKDKTLSNDGIALCDRMFKTLVAEGKTNSVGPFVRNLAVFLSWVESSGHAINNIPAEAFIEWLRVEMGHLAPGSRDTFRAMFKSMFNRITAEMGLDLSHMAFDDLEKARNTTREGRKEGLQARKAAAEANRLDARVKAVQEMLAKGQPLRNVITNVAPPVVPGFDLQHSGGYVPHPQAIPPELGEVIVDEADVDAIELDVDAREDMALSGLTEEMSAKPVEISTTAQRIEEPAVSPFIDSSTPTNSTASKLPASVDSSAFNAESATQGADSHMEESQQMSDQTVVLPAQTPNQQPQVIVFQQPKNGGQKQQPNPQQMQAPANGAVQLNVNGIQFRGPFVSILRVMDGTIPGTMSGQEVLVEQAVTRALAQYGTADAYLQKVVLPRIRAQIAPGTAVVSFALVELNAAKQPTNTRADVTVAVVDQPTTMQQTQMQNGTIVVTPYPDPYGAPAMQQPIPPQPNPIENKAADIYLKQLADQAAEARAREDRMREELLKAKDTAELSRMQDAVRREEAMRTELERMRREFEQKLNAPPNLPFAGLPPMMSAPLPPPAPDFNLAEVMRAQAESQKELLIALAGSRQEAPVQPQRDPMEAMTPFLTMMQQQSQQTMQMMMQMQQTAQQQQQAQAAESQKLMIAMQQAQQAQALENQKLVVSILTKEKPESDFDKMMKTMMLKKFTDDEGGVEKLAKSAMAMRQAAEALGMGGGGGGGVIDGIVNNLPGILGGFAKMQQAAAIGKQVRGPVAPSIPVNPPPRAPVQTQAIVPANTPAPQTIAQAPAQADLPIANEQQPEQQSRPNPSIETTSEVRAAAAGLVAAAQSDDGDLMSFMGALQVYVMALANGSPEDQQRAQVLLTEFKRADCYEEVWNVAKFALVFGGIVSSRDDIGAVADMLHQGYTEIFGALSNGEAKVLSDADRWQDEEEDGESEQEEA